jgi:Leucine-rich repeat (LRR) protein
MLPAAMSGLTSLTKLSLDGSMVGNWPAAIATGAASLEGGTSASGSGSGGSAAQPHLPAGASCCNVRHLSLTDTGLRGSLPSFLPSLTALLTLNLSTNMITALAPEIARLQALTYLSVAHNHLSCVPEVLGRLCDLKELHLAHNHIIVVSPALFTLSKLQVLVPPLLPPSLPLLALLSRPRSPLSTLYSPVRPPHV